MDDEVKHLQADFRKLEDDAAEGLGGLHDPALDTPTEDGRTIRKVMHDLTDSYRQHTEQLLWTKWGQRIPRKESQKALAELQAARAGFAAYLTDLQAEQLDVKSAPAENASAREVVQELFDEEAQALDLIYKALSAPKEEEESHGR